MNGTEYTPRAGSKGDTAWQHVKEHGRTARLDLADVMDCPSNNVDNNISLCLKHGLIVRDDGYYDLGDGTPLAEPTNTEAAPAGPARNGSQTPDDAAAIPGARAGSEPTQGPLTAVQTRDAGLATEASESAGAESLSRIGVQHREARSESAQDRGKEIKGDHAEQRSPAGRKARKFKAPRTVGAKPKSKPKVGKVPRLPPDPLQAELTPVAVQKPARFGAFSDGEMHIEKQGSRIVLERFEFETLLRFLTRMCAQEGA